MGAVRHTALAEPTFSSTLHPYPSAGLGLDGPRTRSPTGLINHTFEGMLMTMALMGLMSDTRCVCCRHYFALPTICLCVVCYNRQYGRKDVAAVNIVPIFGAL